MVAATHARPALDAAARLTRLKRLAWLLDAQFALPGTRVRFGLNGLIGLVPAAGDAVMGAISLLIVMEARAMGAPSPLIARMLANVAVEVAGGSIPLLGDLFDVAFKANLRNIRLLEDWAGRT